MKNWVGLVLMRNILKGPVACFQIDKAWKRVRGGVPEMEVKYGKGKTEKDLKDS